MDIQDMRIFCRVCALRNLSATGNELGLTPGTISKRLQALEDYLGVRLFDRTTRRIRITAEGEIFLTHVERILTEIDEARAAVGDQVERPKGQLKISAPAALGRRFIAPLVIAFKQAFPDIIVQIDLSDRFVSLHEDGYDVAIRTGALADSGLIAKRLTPDQHFLVAAPAYLKAHGTPEQPEDLRQHNCLVLGDILQWVFADTDGDGEGHAIRVSGDFRSSSGDLLREAAIAGLGIIRTSELRVLKELREGTLVRVLPDDPLTHHAAVWAVYPSSKHVLPKLRVFLDFAADWFSSVRDGGKSGSTAKRRRRVPAG